MSSVRGGNPSGPGLIATTEVGGENFQRVLVAPDAGIAMPTIPPSLWASLYGTIAGREAWPLYILGRRTIFTGTSPFQDVCQFLVGAQAAYTEPDVATVYYARSTATGDAPGQNGVSKVRLVSLDAAGAEQVTTITLAGQTAVSIGSGFSYFQWLESSEVVGTGVAAAGDITIGSVNGAATEATTMVMIKAGGNRSMDAKYKVPTGHTLFLSDWFGSCVNQDMDVRLRATVFADDRQLSPDIYHFQSTMYLALNTARERTLPWLAYRAGAEIKSSALPGAVTGSPRVDVTVNGLLVAD